MSCRLTGPPADPIAARRDPDTQEFAAVCGQLHFFLAAKRNIAAVRAPGPWLFGDTRKRQVL
jgi:hypothetical protein